MKSVRFVGYTDACSAQRLQALTLLTKKAGIKLVGKELFMRADTSVTAQPLKLAEAAPDAMDIAALGNGAAMPQLALVERCLRDEIHQTRAASTAVLMRLGAKATKGNFFTADPLVVAELLPDSRASRAPCEKFTATFEAIPVRPAERKRGNRGSSPVFP